nr:PfkB family carbohydrate kinase [Candidatus Sigynarchaeum springense]MDO8118551.1 PfkB family carbohydrate kinase [Candidatus Sigynarchaeota archaeon]
MKKPFDLVILGHMAMDTVIHVENGKRNVHTVSSGGAVTFGSLAAKTSDPSARIGIGSKIGKDFPAELLQPFKQKDIDLSCLLVDEKSPSTRFELVYDAGKRTVSCPARCSELLFADFPPELWTGKRFHVGAICREISLPFIEQMGKAIAGRAPVGIDLQGVLRDISPDGRVGLISQENAFAATRKIYDVFGERLFIKGDDFECAAVSGIDEPIKCIEYLLAEFKESTIMLTLGRKGSYLGKNVGRKAKIERIPAFKPAKIVDETGAGDTFLVSFLSRLGNSSCSIDACKDAALFASAASSFLVEDTRCKGLRSSEAILARVKQAIYM